MRSADGGSSRVGDLIALASAAGIAGVCQFQQASSHQRLNVAFGVASVVGHPHRRKQFLTRARCKRRLRQHHTLMLTYMLTLMLI